MGVEENLLHLKMWTREKTKCLIKHGRNTRVNWPIFPETHRKPPVVSGKFPPGHHCWATRYVLKLGNLWNCQAVITQTLGIFHSLRSLWDWKLFHSCLYWETRAFWQEIFQKVYLNEIFEIFAYWEKIVKYYMHPC